MSKVRPTEIKPLDKLLMEDPGMSHYKPQVLPDVRLHLKLRLDKVEIRNENSLSP